MSRGPTSKRRLRVVDPDSPARSELLSRALVPHGPHKRPIFRGATDPEYQRVAAWVNSLRRTAAVEPSAPARFGPASRPPPLRTADSVGFATEPRHPASSPAPIAPNPSFDGRPQPPAAPNPVIPRPPGQFVAGSGSGMQPYAPPDADFTVPYMMGGPRPKPPATPGQAQSPAQAAAAAGVELPPLPTAAPSARSAPGGDRSAPDGGGECGGSDGQCGSETGAQADQAGSRPP